MRRVLCATLLTLLASSAWAQTPEQIVARQRAKFGSTVSVAETPVLLKAIAVDLTQTLGSPYGLLPKVSGNQCGGYACDIICNAQFHWDVLKDGADATMNPPYAGAAVPGWQADGAVPRPCELMAASVPGPTPLPTPTTGGILPAPSISWLTPELLQSLFADVRKRIGVPDVGDDSMYAQAERMFAYANAQRDTQTDTLVTAVNSPGWFKQVFGNRYVQLALAGAASYVTTHQMMK